MATPTPSHGRPPQVRGVDDVNLHHMTPTPIYTDHMTTPYYGEGQPPIADLDDGGVGEILQRQQETTGRDRTPWFLGQGRSAQTRDMARMHYADDEDTVTHIPNGPNWAPPPPPISA